MQGIALTQLTLSHFRSHRNTRLDTDGRPMAFIGPNGAGKTNILEAVSLLTPGRGLRRAAIDELSRAPDNLGWKVVANVTSPGFSHQLETWAEPGKPRQVRIDEKAASQVSLGKIVRMVWLIPSMDRLWLEGADGRRRFLDRTALSFFPEHADATLAYEKSMRERNRLLKDHVSDEAWYNALEWRMAESGAQIESNRRETLARLRQAQARVETAFPTAELGLTYADDSAAFDSTEKLAETLARGRKADFRAGRTLAGPHRADLTAIYATKNMSARLCSTGEQKALLISLILANARALKDEIGLAPIILLDEVAAHLDAERRAALFDEICGLGAQAWMTGTDASLFEAFEGRARLFTVRDTGRETHLEEFRE